MGEIIELNNFRTKDRKDQNDFIEKIINDSMNKVNNKLFILIGIPCSGKSTYANKFILNNPNTILISTDEIRKQITGVYQFSEKTNLLVMETAKKMLYKALMQGMDVIYDATNTNKNYRKSIIKISKQTSLQTIGVVFKTPVTICLKRNAERNSERRIPEHVIVAMSVFDSDIKKTEGFDEVMFINYRL